MVALCLEQSRGNRGVDAATHGYYYLHSIPFNTQETLYFSYL